MFKGSNANTHVELHMAHSFMQQQALWGPQSQQTGAWGYIRLRYREHVVACANIPSREPSTRVSARHEARTTIWFIEYGFKHTRRQANTCMHLGVAGRLIRLIDRYHGDVFLGNNVCDGYTVTTIAILNNNNK